MQKLKDLTQTEVIELKNITEGTIFWGGCVVHLSEDFTAYDYLVSMLELERQSNIDTATGQSLRNLAAICGVYEQGAMTDEQIRERVYQINQEILK